MASATNWRSGSFSKPWIAVTTGQGHGDAQIRQSPLGKRGATELDVAAFLGVCRIKGPERKRLLALCQEWRTPGWFQQHGSRLPKQLVTLIDHENKAAAISDFEAIFVPGLLQTGEYARAVISRNVNVPADEVDDRVATRLARQSVFSRDRPARFAFCPPRSARMPPWRILGRSRTPHWARDNPGR